MIRIGSATSCGIGVALRGAGAPLIGGQRAAQPRRAKRAVAPPIDADSFDPDTGIRPDQSLLIRGQRDAGLLLRRQQPHPGVVGFASCPRLFHGFRFVLHVQSP